jgi:hypothetical protein
MNPKVLEFLELRSYLFQCPIQGMGMVHGRGCGTSHWEKEFELHAHLQSLSEVLMFLRMLSFDDW